MSLTLDRGRAPPTPPIRCAPLRDRFALPDGLDLSRRQFARRPAQGERRRASSAVVEREWGEALIRSWNDHDWIDAPQRIGAKIAPLIGAKPHEVIVADSTSVNLFKLLVAAAALSPTGRCCCPKPGNFHTDLHIASGVADLLGSARSTSRRAREVEARIGADTNLLLLTHVHYKSGRALRHGGGHAPRRRRPAR